MAAPGRHGLRATVLAAMAAIMLATVAARAQFAGIGRGPQQPVSRDQPVYYQSDTASYDRDGALVTLAGHVEIWQGDRVLRADQVTYDRNTGVAAARGHVVLLEPGGQVVFSDYAELTGGLKDGIMRDLSARLAENGKLAANGARRTDGKVNELSRAIYSTCNVCAKHPERTPLWDLRARSALQDLVNKRIEYRDAVLDFYGVPVAYFPYFTHADPSVKRASGFLVPSIGQSTHLGAYAAVPYFWAIDPQSDATITPTLDTATGPGLDVDYRRRFNDGAINIDGSIAYDQKALQAAVFAKGQFAINDEWRWGFDINSATSANYLRDFKIQGGITDLLASQVYLEGFGQGAYSRLDTRYYQGISSSIVSSELPYVLPRYEYSFVGEPDALGGRLSVDAGGFNVIRDVGNDTQRASLALNWDRPFTGAAGDLWKLKLHLDSAAYSVEQLNQEPSFGPRSSATTAQAMPSAAVSLHWPLARDAGSWGNQLIEPIAQVIVAPNGSSYGRAVSAAGVAFNTSLVPNEDSLATEFTDSNLFSLNRFPGIDRLEGGTRAAVALHGAWYLPNGGVIDGLIGQSYRVRKDDAFMVGSGLNGTVSDIVSHLDFTPNPYLDLTSQQRFDHKNGDVRFADALASVGPSWLRLNGGYIFTSTNPYFYYNTPPTGALLGPPRNEITVGGNTGFGPYKFNGYVRRDLQTHKLVGVGFGGSYEDECFIFSGSFFRRYTSIDNDGGASTLLFQITLKTVGQFGYHAL